MNEFENVRAMSFEKGGTLRVAVDGVGWVTIGAGSLAPTLVHPLRVTAIDWNNTTADGVKIYAAPDGQPIGDGVPLFRPQPKGKP